MKRVFKVIGVDFLKFVKKGWIIALALLGTWLLFSPILVFMMSQYFRIKFSTKAVEVYQFFFLTAVPAGLIFVIYLAVGRTLWLCIFNRKSFWKDGH